MTLLKAGDRVKLVDDNDIEKGNYVRILTKGSIFVIGKVLKGPVGINLVYLDTLLAEPIIGISLAMSRFEKVQALPKLRLRDL